MDRQGKERLWLAFGWWEGGEVGFFNEVPELSVCPPL